MNSSSADAPLFTNDLPLPFNEAQRLDALRDACILDTLPTAAFDDLTRLAAQICGAPLAAISLVDADRQWFKSILGIDQETNEIPRRGGFCSYTILQTDVFVVPDARSDERFRANPMVSGEPYLRFYAGAPLLSPDGHALGALCIMDQVPRRLTAEQTTALAILARQAAGQIELTRRMARQEQLAAEHSAAQRILEKSEQRLLEAQRVAKIGSWEFDVATGRITWSAEMFRLLGFDLELGEPDHEALVTHYHPDDVALHDAALQKALEEGAPYEYDVRILPSVGLMRWGYVMGQAACNEEGRVVRVFGTLMDITERKQAEEESARLAAIIEHSSDAVLGTTLDGTLVSWNKSAERLYGYREGEIIGQHASVLTTPEQARLVPSVIETLKRGQPSCTLEMQGRRRDGTLVETVQTFSPIRNQIGEVVGVAAIGHDITEQRRAEDAQRRAEDAVRRSESRLAEAQQVARIGSWEMDAATAELVFSEEMYRLFEIDPAAGMPSQTEILARYHPDDVEAHLALVSRSMTDHAAFVTDLRIVGRSGEIRWVHVIGKPVFGEDGSLLHFVGTMMDITERVRNEERFRVLFECSPEAHFLLNSGGIIDCNQAGVQMFRGASKEALVKLHPISLSPQFQPDGRLSSDKGRAIHKAAAQNGIQSFEWIHQRQDGEQFPAKVIVTPVTLNGAPTLLAVIHDLTERKQAEQRIHDYAVLLEQQKRELEQANRELSSLATTDGLTGLKNHRAFQERLHGECETALRHQTPLSLVLLDVDHFKLYNDKFGHPAGDAVLKQFARLLEHTLRDCDFAARYGGEEFVVILPQTDQAGALEAAERMREAVEAAAWDCRPVTASLGVAVLSLGCADSASLIAAADRALYAAKFHGRNQVRHEASSRLCRTDTLHR